MTSPAIATMLRGITDDLIARRLFDTHLSMPTPERKIADWQRDRRSAWMQSRDPNNSPERRACYRATYDEITDYLRLKGEV